MFPNRDTPRLAVAHPTAGRNVPLDPSRPRFAARPISYRARLPTHRPTERQLDSRSARVPLQSSPAPRSGCNDVRAFRSARVGRFQSSPAPRSGCNCFLHRDSQGQDPFQSSPAPRSGCNLAAFDATVGIGWFQSSPAPRSGCNAQTVRPVTEGVVFQSSPAPRSGCNPVEQFYLHQFHQFQSSPAPRSGCNSTIVDAQLVWILLPPFANPLHISRPTAIHGTGDFTSQRSHRCSSHCANYPGFFHELGVRAHNTRGSSKS